MTTLILRLPVVMAKRVARACDALKMESHEAVGLKALDEFLTSVIGPIRGRRAGSQRGKRINTSRGPARKARRG